jgi:hypothetical protein
MSDALSVDKEWKEEAMKAKEEMAEKTEKTEDTPFVSVAEVKQYLTELSGVLNQISEGIGESIKTMDGRLKKKETNSNDDQD